MSKLKYLNSKELGKLTESAASSKRLRANLNFHPQPEDTVQRFCNAMEPGTFIRPHRHRGIDKWEFMIAVQGAALLLIFAADGKLEERLRLSSDGPNFGIEIPADTWHSLFALESGTVLFEFKQGPYTPTSDKDFAAWAPKEGDSSTNSFLQWFETATIGSMPPPL